MTDVSAGLPDSGAETPALRVTVATRGAVRADLRDPVPVQVVRVDGDVDLTTAPMLTAGLDQAQAAGPPPGPDGETRGVPKRVVVDATPMTFCGARGLAALVAAARVAARRNTVWAVAGLGPRLGALVALLWPGPQPVRYRDRDAAVTAVGLGSPWPVPAGPAAPITGDRSS